MEPWTPRVHYNNFNLIRLVAALQVLLVHAVNHFGYQAWFVDALKVVPGVPAFFFTSGFLIYSAYERMRSQSRPGFFVNRVLRIYPGLVVCVLLSALSVYLTGYFDGRRIDLGHFVAWIVGQSTVFQFYNPQFMRDYGVGVLNGALWTISVEIQFYVLVPLLCYLLRNRPRVLALIFAISLTVNVVANILLVRDPRSWDLLYMKLLMVSFIPHLFMFLLGFFAASTDKVRNVVNRIDLKYLAIAYALSMNLIGTYHANASNAINPVSFGLLALMIVKISTLPSPLPTRLERFVENTDFSYGLYLYHMPIINLLLTLALFSVPTNIVLSVAAAFCVAAASWFLIEKPTLSHKR